MTGTSAPCSLINCLAERTSLPERTNDKATASTPCSRPNSRSLRSLSVNAGIVSATPGKLIPWCSPSKPPLITSHSRSSPRMLRTRSSINPSESKICAPGSTSRAKPPNVVGMRVGVPAISRGAMVMCDPALRTTGVCPFRRPVRILGPCRSCRMQMPRPSLSAVRRRRSILRTCSL